MNPPFTPWISLLEIRRHQAWVSEADDATLATLRSTKVGGETMRLPQ